MKGQEKLADMGVFANKTDLEIILSFFFFSFPCSFGSQISYVVFLYI